MPLFSSITFPDVDNCCGCINDVKTATAIIAVLGIVTSPLLSWAVVRHAYVIRVSCFISTSSTRPDVIDINLSNVLSFGFGANAGLGPSCLTKNSSSSYELDDITSYSDKTNSTFITVVKYFGWIVLIVDVFFLLCSLNLLLKVFQEPATQAATLFIASGLLSIILSFIYGMLYISACVHMGGSFPVFEFVFAIFDIALWTYYLIVVNSFRQKSGTL